MSTNAPLVNLLLAGGAIIHCKTNLPQAALAIDSVNNVFGRVLNPQNRQQWTAGGSSGGEGVMVKMRGSLMGIGTDVGGSVRIPAMCNGILGFKPSGGRLPASGQELGQPAAVGKVGLESAVGVLAREWDDIDIILGAIEGGRAWDVDPEVVPGHWWTHVNPYNDKSGKMTVGVIYRDGITEPLPPVRRALCEVVQKLKSSDIQVIDIDAKRLKDCQPLTNEIFSAEGGEFLRSLIKQTNEPLIPWLQRRLKAKEPANLDKWRDLLARKQQLQKDWLEYWKGPNGETVDAIICPVAPHPVPPPDRWNTISCTSSFVLLDYPAVSMPVGTVSKGDLGVDMEGSVLGSWDRENRKLCEQTPCHGA